MRHTEDIVYFDFRIIKADDGTEVIDRSLRTPMDALAPPQQIEYMQIYEALAVSDRLERRRKEEKVKIHTFTCHFKKTLAAVCLKIGGLNAWN